MPPLEWNQRYSTPPCQLTLTSSGARFASGEAVTEWTMAALDDATPQATIRDHLGLEVLVQVLGVKDAFDRLDEIEQERPPERPRHPRIFGGGRGGTWTAWIFARRVRFSARGIDGVQEMSFEELIADGVPQDFTSICGADIADTIKKAARELAPLECMCGTGCETPEQHGDLHRLSSARDPRAPYDVTADLVECVVCSRWWTFSERGDSHYSYTRSLSQFIPTFASEP